MSRWLLPWLILAVAGCRSFFLFDGNGFDTNVIRQVFLCRFSFFPVQRETQFWIGWGEDPILKLMRRRPNFCSDLKLTTAGISHSPQALLLFLYAIECLLLPIVETCCLIYVIHFTKRSVWKFVLSHICFTKHTTQPSMIMSCLFTAFVYANLSDNTV